MGRCVLQNVRVTDDHIGAAAGKGSLQIVQGHGGCGTGVAVHGGGSAHNDVFSAGNVAEDLADVIDDTAAHTDDQVTLIIKVHDGGAYGMLVGFQGGLRENILGIGNPGFLQQGADCFARCSEGVHVRHHKGPLRAVVLHELRDAPDGTAAHDHFVDCDGVGSTAGAAGFEQIVFHKKYPRIML